MSVSPGSLDWTLFAMCLFVVIAPGLKFAGEHQRCVGEVHFRSRCINGRLVHD